MIAQGVIHILVWKTKPGAIFKLWNQKTPEPVVLVCEGRGRWKSSCLKRVNSLSSVCFFYQGTYGIG